MTKHSDAFIDLDRTFSKIPLDADASDDVSMALGANLHAARSNTNVQGSIADHKMAT